MAKARRRSKVDHQQREVEAFVAPRPFDGLRDAIDQQEAIGQPGQAIGHHRDRDVRLRAAQTDRASGVVSDDHAAARHPAVGSVFVPQPILALERRRVSEPRRLDFAFEFFLVFGMDFPEPILRRVADFVVFTTGEGHPSRREMNPVGFQIPVPARLAVAARTFGTAGARARAFFVQVSLTLSAASRYAVRTQRRSARECPGCSDKMTEEIPRGQRGVIAELPDRDCSLAGLTATVSTAPLSHCSMSSITPAPRAPAVTRSAMAFTVGRALATATASPQLRRNTRSFSASPTAIVVSAVRCNASSAARSPVALVTSAGRAMMDPLLKTMCQSSARS